jgi:citrate synthase
MTEQEQGWKTAITEVKPNEIRLRGYRIDELMGRVTFAQAIYLALTGDLPSPQIGRLLDAMLVASIDHGATPPSTLAARTAASTGAPLNGAIAAGLLSINRHHGGAIEDCMHLLQRVIDEAGGDESILEHAASRVVGEYAAARRRLPGLGHRLHTADPRTARLLDLAHEAGVAGRGVRSIALLARALEAQTGRAFPINVDGALAAILLDLGISPELGNAFFLMARVPGLVAQIREEQTRERPMRAIDPHGVEYDGPAPRSLPSEG